jgi:hypothetical protein
LYSYLKQTKMSLFLEKWRIEGQNRSCWGGGRVGVIGTSEGEEDKGKGMGG